MGIGVLGWAAFLQTPGLVFNRRATDQPRITEGVPSWHDTVFVERDTVVVRHLRIQRFYTHFSATLRRTRDSLTVTVQEQGPAGEGGVPGGALMLAYEARIGALIPGRYVVLLKDEGYNRAPLPFSLAREVVIP
jgi:hypothetical protein